jgi:hypothetical protein
MKKSLCLIFILISTFAHSQLSNGLIAMFPFDQNYNDLGPNAIVVNPTGTSFTDDRMGIPSNGLSLGSQNYIDFNNSALKIDLPITISVWVKGQSFANFNMIFISDNVYNNYYGYWLNIAANTGQIGAHVAAGLGGANSSNRRTFLTTNGLSLNTWHHIVAVIRGAQDMKIYIDCELQSGTYSGTGALNINYSNENSCIGGYVGNSTNTNGAYLIGDMDQLVFWNRELTMNEIQEICQKNNDLGTTEQELVADVSVYPNPFTSEFTISSKLPETYSYELLDINGKVLLKGMLAGQTNKVLNLDAFAPGTYLLQTKKGEYINTQRLVKQ